MLRIANIHILPVKTEINAAVPTIFNFWKGVCENLQNYTHLKKGK